MLVSEIVLNEIRFRNTLAAAALGAASIANFSHNNKPTTGNVPELTAQQLKQVDQEASQDTKLYTSTIDKEISKNRKDVQSDSFNDWKSKFIKQVKPLIDKENLRIHKDREFLLTLPSHMSQSQKERFDRICKEYGTHNYHDLLLRVDVVPTELALAQAALESGWGRSNYAVDNKSLFGQRANKDSMSFADYSNFNQSITSYMHNLNTNAAYKKFRDSRYYMRIHGDKLNASLLARTLTAYDSTGIPYTKKVQQIIGEIPKDVRVAYNDTNSYND